MKLFPHTIPFLISTPAKVMDPILQLFPKLRLKFSFNKFIIINCYYNCLIHSSEIFCSVLFDPLSFEDKNFSFITGSA